MVDQIYIGGQKAGSLTLVAATANKAAVDAGIYDCYCDVDVFVAVNPTNDPVTGSANAASVTVNNGYKIFAGNVIPIVVGPVQQIEAICVAGGTFKYMKVGN